MGLEFTQIEDNHGAAVYVIYDGLTRSEQKMKHLADEIQKHTSKQVIPLSTHDSDAMKIIDFYDLHAGNQVLIVRDNDELHYIWSELELPAPDQIGFMANQVG